MNWYEPYDNRNAAESRQQNKKSKKPGRIAGVVVLALLLIAGAWLAIGNMKVSFGSWSYSPSTGFESFYSDSASDSDKLPEDFKDFFSSAYSATATDSADVRIPLYEGDMDFSLTLEKAEGEELSLQEIYDRCSPVIVSVSVYKDGESGYGWGSGIIASEDGFIVTNTHIVNGMDSAVVQLSTGETYDAKIVGADAVSDIALLKIEPEEKLPAAVFADTSTLNEGDEVAAIGNPLGAAFRNTLTNGIISAIDRGIPYNGHALTLLQTNTALNEGNSGGGLFNMQGQVIGVTNMKMMSYYSSIEGIGFAIPSSTVESVVNSLIENGYVPRSSLGITVGAIPAAAKKNYDLPDGLYISAVREDSDAAAKGIMEGDIMTAFNGTPVKTTTDVNAIKDSFSIGDTVTITIYRRDTGETFDAEVQLGEYRDLYE